MDFSHLFFFPIFVRAFGVSPSYRLRRINFLRTRSMFIQMSSPMFLMNKLRSAKLASEFSRFVVNSNEMRFQRISVNELFVAEFAFYRRFCVPPRVFFQRVRVLE